MLGSFESRINVLLIGFGLRSTAIFHLFSWIKKKGSYVTHHFMGVYGDVKDRT